MKTYTQREQKILEILLRQVTVQSSDIHTQLIQQGDEVSLVTVKRLLSELSTSGVIAVIGSGRSTAYIITVRGRLTAPIDAHAYCAVEPDKRFGMSQYNFTLFEAARFDLFTPIEKSVLSVATHKYHTRNHDVSPAITEKELERFIIELSWKSSRIEGNTYTLLDTEKLIRDGIEAAGHSRDEAIMILNHKEAFKFIREHASEFKNLTRKNMEEVHKILINGLNVNMGLRKKPVGVTGSLYRPLDNIHQISEAVEDLCASVNAIADPYTKTLMTLVGVSYIQPFEDGNKRTARLIANALLLAHKCAPLSYRSIDENIYREAMLTFYELNSVMPFKKIFIEQYIFSAENYLVE